MCHSRAINNRINHLCKRLHNEKILSFKELLQKDVSVVIHNRNLEILATEFLKVYNNIAPPIFTEIFNRKSPNYQLCHNLHFSVPLVRRAYNRAESLSFLGPKIWDIVL